MNGEGYEEGLILLKCQECKTPTLFKLEICHEEDPKYRANSYCSRCESEDKLRKLYVRSLEPALVESQRIEPVCHEPDREQDTETDQ